VATDGVNVSSVARVVNVAAAPPVFTEDSSRFEALAPKSRVVLRVGDTLDLSCQGAPGGAASFKFVEGGEYIPMEEYSKTPGVYRGVYTFKPTDDFDESDIQFSLKRKDGKKLTTKAGASVTLQRRRSPRVIELKEETTFLTGPESDYGYNMFGITGTRLEVTGEREDFFRVAIGDSNQGWIRKSAARELPLGTIPGKSVSRNVRISTTADSTIISIPLQYRHAYRIDQSMSPYNIRLTFFGVIADTDRIRYVSRESVVKEVTWAQSEPTTCVFDIRTKQEQGWGYDARYEGETFILEIRHRPQWVGKNGMLKGIKVAVDAGHTPTSFGTIGPWANTEASECFLVAKVVKQELERRGAEVVMTQDGTKEISLQGRVDEAWKAKANFFISIHADACPEGQNPRDVEGYSVHYYHPQSRSLAEIIYEDYGQRSGIRDQGLWRSNLAVCRAPQMISLLLEQGFLMLPEFEAMALTPKHQKMVADNIASSLWEFMDRHPK
jgi:N-acetylmuramoyl-L-alanine amidase